MRGKTEGWDKNCDQVGVGGLEGAIPPHCCWCCSYYLVQVEAGLHRCGPPRMVFCQLIHPNQQYENLNRNHDRLYLKDCDCWLDVLELFEFVEFLLVPVENGHFQFDAAF